MDKLRASKVYKENFPMETWFERAIFISWYCARPTCKFCFMYTIKDNIKKPRKARRRLESIFAETLICKICNWEIGFLSAGIASWPTSELKEVLEGMCKIYGKKIWLNLGTMKEKQLVELAPYVEGVTGTVECVNEKLRNDIVPDKPLDKIEEMFLVADKLKMKKAITIIIGLEETIADYPNLKYIIEKWKIDRINFYRLVPHEHTQYKAGPSTEYYAEWISKTRIDFPSLQIVAGSWPDKTEEIPLLLEAGANSITKFPAIKLFGTEQAKQIEEGVEKVGRKFLSNLTKYPKVDAVKMLHQAGFDEEMTKRILDKYNKYLKKINSNTRYEV